VSPHSAGFRWTLRAVVLVAFLALAYQLWGGELCTLTRRLYVCSSGARAYVFAAVYVLVGLGVWAITLPQRWADTARKICWVLAGVCIVLSLLV
jgi:hypothetical protein